MQKTARIAAAALIFAVLAADASPQRPAYAAGQVWDYKTRPGDEGSLLRVQKIEDVPDFAKLGPVYHISIVGVHFGGGAGASAIEHAPVSRGTLDASVTRLSASATTFPDPETGIAEWRAARGGVFTIPVAEIVAAADYAMHPPSASAPSS